MSACTNKQVKCQMFFDRGNLFFVNMQYIHVKYYFYLVNFQLSEVIMQKLYGR